MREQAIRNDKIPIESTVEPGDSARIRKGRKRVPSPYVGGLILKRSLIVLAALFLAAALFAQTVPVPQGADLVDDFGDGELSLFMDVSGGYAENLIINGGGGLQYFGSTFALTAEVYLRRDGIYDGNSANTSTGDVGGLYFWMESGGIAYRIGNLLLRGGRLPHYDAINSPYSLFINGDGLSANLLEIDYDDGRFKYTSRWIELNRDNDVETTTFDGGYPDRGANLKNYSVRFGNMNFGIQDAVVYVDKTFDFEYFVSPIPNYVIQEARRQTGRPWSDGGEENNIIGLFWTWERPAGLDIHAQWLLDDGNLYFLSPSTFPTRQPFKMAWAGGFSKETSLGTFSFFHAGATKYTFEPTYGKPGMEYGYAYFPDTVFERKSGAEDPIPFESMMLGYKHGENNLAFLGTWKGDIAGFDLGASLEFTVSGSKSPANAWQEANWHHNQGTELLYEDRLEWKVLAALGATRKLGNFLVYGGIAAGYVFNELELVVENRSGDGSTETPEYNSIGIWKPSDRSRFLWAATVGGRYRLKIK